MTWYADGSTCSWYRVGDHPDLQPRAIGWLDGEHGFERGAVDPSFYERLKRLAEKPFEPIVTAGVHRCEVCQFPEAVGARNLIVPGDGFLYICPELIVHYVAVHSYLPPEDFRRAVERCPEMGTAAYRLAYLENGGRELQRAIKGSSEA